MQIVMSFVENIPIFQTFFFKFVTFVVSFNPQVMGWGGGGENYDELWTEIFNIPVILGVIIVLFLFSERQTCPPRLLICCYFQPYKFGGGLTYIWKK